MKSMVVLFALASVACASWAPAFVAPYAHTVAVAPIAVSAPAAVSYQNRYDAPVYGYVTLGYAGRGHYLHKRSLYAAPVVVAAAPSAVSHQSRVDVISTPAVVSHAVATPVLAPAAPVVAVAPAAVSHQSRVDVRTSSGVVAQTVVAPIGYAARYTNGYGYNGYNGYNLYNSYNGYNAYNGYYNSAPLVSAW